MEETICSFFKSAAGKTLDDAVKAVDARLGSQRSWFSGPVKLDNQLKDIIALARERAMEAGFDEVSPFHLLYGVAHRNMDSFTSYSIWDYMGINESALQKTIDLITRPPLKDTALHRTLGIQRAIFDARYTVFGK
jgi:hypothetical protein